MRVLTRHTPTSGVARVVLAAGEAVEAPADSLLAASYGIADTREGKWSSVFTAPARGGWVDLAPEVAGDVHPLELDGRTGWSVARDAVLARPVTVRQDHPWPALRTLFGNDSGFLRHYSGAGPLVLAARGPVDPLKVEPAEIITVNPLFLLAYPDGAEVRLRAVDPARPQSVRTGAGLALDVAGPATVLVQTRRRP